MRFSIKTLILLLFIGQGTFFAQTYLGDYTSYNTAGKKITIFADTSSVQFIFYKPDIVRVDFHPSPSTVIDSSFIVVQDTNQNANYTLNDFTDSLEISTSAITIICKKYPLRFSFENSSGKILLSEPTSGGISSNGNERTINFNLTNEDHFYGTGERGTDLDKRGQSFYSFNTQIGGYSSPLSTMNINVPFFTDKKGYAIYIDNTYPGWFDFGDSDITKFSYKASGGEMSYYFIAAPTVPDQLEEYTWLTGRQPLPPKWAFGYIQSKYGYRNESAAEAMVDTMRQKQIPCDAIILDLYWYNQMGDVSWDFVNWPSPFQMMSDFLNEGIKTIVITEPYIVQYSTNFQTAYSNGYFAFNQQGDPVLIPNFWYCGCNAGLIDLTNPAAKNWWWNKHPSFFGSQLAGIWTDLGEPETHPSTMHHYLGSRDKVHNIYDFLWSQLIYDGISQIRPNQRVFNLTRSGFAGSQRYGVIPWSGDVAKEFGGLKVQLPMLLNMGMSGFGYHNSDIGGFCCGTTTPELYIRWMQYGTFCPITRAHGIDSQPTEPWEHGELAEQISKYFISLRYKLLPYIYTMAYENYKTGMPLARPLFFYYPDDQSLDNYSDEYMWGSSILVAPIVNEGQTSKNIYLPQGEWIDFYHDVVYQGGQSYNIQTPINDLPLFIKRGSIIPMQPLMNYTDEFPLDTLTLEIYPSTQNPASYSLYEDDGKTLDYQNGSYAITDFSQSFISDNELEINIGPSLGNFSGKLPQRTYLNDIHQMGSSPTSVMKNGNVLIQRTSYNELRSNEEGYYYDGSTRRLYVQIKASTDSSYQIKAEGIVLNASSTAKLVPDGFILEQNYPNPFNPNTTIEYKIPKTSTVTLKVYDILGREVKTLVNNETKQPGIYQVNFDASDLSSGVYFYKLSAISNSKQAGNFINVKKMILEK